MSLQVLELFHKAGIIVYALPAHTSGKPQPLDLVAFPVFKEKVNNAISNSVVPLQQQLLTLYQFCDCSRVAHRGTFVPPNIVAGFRRSGLWPIDPFQLLHTLL